MPAFQIAGGILLMLVSLDMLRAQRIPVKASPEEEEEGMEKNDIAVTPLGIPLLAGPGAITTVLLFSRPTTDIFLRSAVVLGNIFLVSALSFIILWFVAIRSASISVIAMRITTRLMGLLLLAISVQFILNGVKAFIAGI
jgi:multiple antibiotic resistance protein